MSGAVVGLAVVPVGVGERLLRGGPAPLAVVGVALAARPEVAVPQVCKVQMRMIRAREVTTCTDR